MTTLQNKTALVTGASRGIGRATAVALAEAGAHVLVHYGRSKQEAEYLVAEIQKKGGHADAIPADLASPEGAALLAKQVRAIAGDRLDVLVLNAGISKAARIADYTAEIFDSLFATNVRGPFFLVQQLLQGKVAVITGGTTGIGLAAAKLFVKEGAYVFITGRRQKELDDAVKKIGSNVTGVQGDIAELTDLDRLYEIVATKGRIDVVFANAGVAEFAPLGKITEEHFDRLFDINVKGTLFTVQKSLPLMNDGGSIILNGSVASVKGTPAFGVYGATKAALRSFVRTWTSDLKDRHIRSNVISPGPTDTPVIDGQPADAIARIVSTIPMGRMGEPDEIAKAALFLASDDSSFCHGIELFVDGGRGQV